VPRTIDGETYYTVQEACEIAGVSKSTFLRWVNAGAIRDVSQRDRHGWRLFTEEDIQRISAEKNRIERLQLKISERRCT